MNCRSNFFQRHPLLLYGLFANSAAAAAFHGPLWLLAPLPFLFFFPSRRIFPGILLALSLFVFVKSSHRLPESGSFGTARFTPQSISLLKGPFRNKWRYSGIVREFVSDEGSVVGKNVPCTFYYKEKRGAARPSADADLILQGTVQKNGGCTYTLIGSNEAKWQKTPGPFRFAEWRYKLKKAIADAVKRRIPHPKSAAFLAGMATGDFEDRLMQKELSRFGLQHIMAISGFHFALVAAFFTLFLQLFFSRKKAICLLIFLMSSYFLLLGPTPSIQRAWISTLVLLAGIYSGKGGSGLNTLGAAALIAAIASPAATQTAGYLFSFATTAAILLFTPLFERLLNSLFAPRRLSAAAEMERPSQHGYLFLMALRKTLSLTLAVNLTAAPLALYFFGRFPLTGLFYNLFFPFLAGISLFLLLAGSLLPFIDPLNSLLTNFFLNIAYNMPQSFEASLKAESFSAQALLLYLFLLFLFGIRRRFRLT